MQAVAYGASEDPFEFRKRFWWSQGWVLVRQHWRSRPYMRWTGIRDVFIIEYLRRPPGWRKRFVA